MPSPTWDEYLAEASKHLAAARQACETGGAAPAPPERPSDPIPDGCLDEAHQLALGYDQLAADVAARMASIERRLSPAWRSPHQDVRPPAFVDTSL